VKRPTLRNEAWRDIAKSGAARSDIVDGRRGYLDRQFEVEQLRLTVLSTSVRFKKGGETSSSRLVHMKGIHTSDPRYSRAGETNTIAPVKVRTLSANGRHQRRFTPPSASSVESMAEVAVVAMLYLSRSNASEMRSAWDNTDGGDAESDSGVGQIDWIWSCTSPCSMIGTSNR